MRSARYVLVKAKASYNNVEKIGNISFVVNVDIDNVASINRSAFVVSDFKDLKEGMEVIIHHNIMREVIHTNGSLDKGPYFFGQDSEWKYFYLPESEVIMKKIDNEWVTRNDFIFIKPYTQEDVSIGGGIIFRPDSYKGRKENHATLVIGNEKLHGVNVGDEVVFSNNSEHEFIVDGDILYKCEVVDILAVV